MQQRRTLCISCTCCDLKISNLHQIVPRTSLVHAHCVQLTWWLSKIIRFLVILAQKYSVKHHNRLWIHLRFRLICDERFIRKYQFWLTNRRLGKMFQHHKARCHIQKLPGSITGLVSPTNYWPVHQFSIESMKKLKTWVFVIRNSFQ